MSNIKFHLNEEDDTYEITDMEMFKTDLKNKHELKEFLIKSITERLNIDEAMLSLIKDKMVNVTNPDRSEEQIIALFKSNIKDNRHFLKLFDPNY